MKRFSVFLPILTVAGALFSCNPEVRPDRPDTGNEESPVADELTLLFTNDFHSQILPIDAGATYNAGKGGIERIKVLVDSVRAADKTVLLCDAGDFVQGSFYFTCFGGEVEMMAQKELGYDVKTIGNHEFDKKMTGLQYMIGLNDVPVVCSNYAFSSPVMSGRVSSGLILKRNGLKIGFVGLNSRLSGLVDPSACEGVEWTQALDEACLESARLRSQGADLVVALSHLGYEKESDAVYYDRGIAKNTEDIDCIIGGHSHTFLTRPDYVCNRTGKKVPIVQTGCKGIYLGCLKVRFPKDGDPVFNYRLIPVDSRLDSRKDAGFSGKIDHYTSLLSESMGEVLAYCPVTMRKGRPEGLLSNFTADALVDICEDYFGMRPDMGLYNNGGIRSELPAGDVTRGDIYNIYPFDNTLTLIEVKGKDLLEAFRGISAYGGEAVSSEVRLVIKDGKMESLSLSGKPVEETGTYLVATINYLVDATDYLKALSNYSSRRDSGTFMYELFCDYVKGLGDRGLSVSSQLDGRIVVE